MTIGLMILAAILFVVWLVGFIAFKTAGALIHIVLVLALISFIVSFFSGRRAV